MDRARLASRLASWTRDLRATGDPREATRRMRERAAADVVVPRLRSAMAPELGVDLADECARAIAAVGALEGPDALADAATCAIDHRRREACYGWPALDADQAAALVGRVRDALAKVAS